MAISSINIQMAIIIAFFHNARDAIVSYLIADASRNSYDKNGKEAHAYYLELLKEAIGNYTKRTGQSIQTDEKKFIWEAVINLNESHTLKDVKTLAKLLESTYGWQIVQIALHGDEGHKDPLTGQNVYNHHAHLVFFMLDKNGIYRFKKRDFGIKKMVELQSLVASVLQMERGKSKKETKRVRLDHRQYRQMAKGTEQMKKQISELTEDLSEKQHEIYTLIEDINGLNWNEALQEVYQEDLERRVEEGLNKIAKLEKLVYSEKWTVTNKAGEKVKARNFTVVKLLEKQQKELKEKYLLLKKENASLLTESEDDKYFMSAQSKEMDKFREQSDQHVVKISELEEWKEDVQKTLLEMKRNGVLSSNTLLDKYILPNNSETDTHQESELQSLEGKDTEPEDVNGYGRKI